MGEFVKVASAMTPGVQRMMFEGVQSLAPKVAQEGLIQTALQGAQGGKFFWAIASAGLLSGLLWKGGEYFQLSALVREVKDANATLMASKQDLVVLIQQRQEEFEQMDRGISDLRGLVREVDQRREQLTDGVRTLQGVQEQLNGTLHETVGTIHRLIGVLQEKLKTLRALREEISEQDQEGLAIYTETVQREREFEQYLEAMAERFPPAGSGQP